MQKAVVGLEFKASSQKEQQRGVSCCLISTFVLWLLWARISAMHTACTRG